MDRGGYTSNVHTGANRSFPNNRRFVPTRLVLDDDLPPPYAEAVGMSGQSTNEREESERSDGTDNSNFPITRNASPPPVNVHGPPNTSILMPGINDDVPTSIYTHHESGRILPSPVTNPSNTHGHSITDLLDGHNILYFIESQIWDHTGSVLMFVREDIHLGGLIFSDFTGRSVALCQDAGRMTTITNCISNEVVGHVKQDAIYGSKHMFGRNCSNEEVFQSVKAGTDVIFLSNGALLGNFGKRTVTFEITDTPENVFGLNITSPSMDPNTKLLMLFASYLIFQKLQKGFCFTGPSCNCSWPCSAGQIAAGFCLIFVISVLVVGVYFIAFASHH